MPKNEDDLFKEGYYEVRTPLVSKLFKNRVSTALELVTIDDKSVVLDIGCLFGYLLKSIRYKNPQTKLYGIDYDSEVIKKTKIENCELRVADARDMPFQNEYFDMAFAMDVLEHIDDGLDTAIREIHRVLKKDGIIILSGPTETWFYRICRFLYIGKFHWDEHKHQVYDIEKTFLSNGFMLVEMKSLPGFPFPELFRVSKFRKV